MATTLSGYSSRSLSRRDHVWYTHVARDPLMICCAVTIGPTRLVAARSRATLSKSENTR